MTLVVRNVMDILDRKLFNGNSQISPNRLFWLLEIDFAVYMERQNVSSIELWIANYPFKTDPGKDATPVFFQNSKL